MATCRSPLSCLVGWGFPLHAARLPPRSSSASSALLRHPGTYDVYSFGPSGTSCGARWPKGFLRILFRGVDPLRLAAVAYLYPLVSLHGLLTSFGLLPALVSPCSGAVTLPMQSLALSCSGLSLFRACLGGSRRPAAGPFSCSLPPALRPSSASLLVASRYIRAADVFRAAYTQVSARVASPFSALSFPDRLDLTPTVGPTLKKSVCVCVCVCGKSRSASLLITALLPSDSST